MNYKQFKNNIVAQVTGSAVKQQQVCFEHLVVETENGQIYIDRELTSFGSMEEATEMLRQQKLQEEIQHEIQQHSYEEISDNKIASIIKNHHGDIRVTDTLIESYVELASSKFFTLDPVAADIRKQNKLDVVIEGKVDFKLEDGSIVMINEDTYKQINNKFGNHPDVIEYMKQSSENFLFVVDQLGEE